MHFYESTIITTKEGMHCQVYGNEHPPGRILVKPKYIPTDRISSDALPSRFLSGKKMNHPERRWLDYLLKRINYKYKTFNSDNEIFYLITKNELKFAQ